MDILFNPDEASTALSEEEKEGLLLNWIVDRKDLNAAERKGIVNAEIWAFGRKHRDILTEVFIKKLHNIMFRDVWKWAGQYRLTERNIGIDPSQIIERVNILLGDTKYWIENQTYSPDEIGARFHHRLVFIHPFPNGNGRHSRLMTDILIKNMGYSRFSWGAGSLVEVSKLRKQYIQALQAADSNNLKPLIDFVRMQ